jgi:tetratricopeptide (TPR) repeat protein/O-antigen ligase
VTADRLSRTALYAVLLFSPLAIGANRPWPLAVVELLTVGGLSCAALRMIREGRLEWLCSATDRPLLLLVGLILVQLGLGNRALSAWALAPPPATPEVSASLPSWFLTVGTVAPVHTARSLLLLLTYLGTYVLVISVIRRRQHLDRLVTTLVAFGGVIAFFGLLDYLAGEARLFRWRDIPLDGRLAGPFANADHFAAWLNMLVCLGLGALAARRASAPAPLGVMLRSRELREDALRRYVPFVGLVAMLLALVFTLSRGGILSLAVTFIALLVLLYRLGRVRWGLAVVTALIIASLTYAAWIGLEPLLHRVRQAHGDIASRWVLTTTSLPMIRSFPLLGVGLGAYRDIYPRYQPTGLEPGRIDVRYAHDDLVQLLVELGVVGAIVVLVLTWRVGRDLIGAHLLGTAACPVEGGEEEGARRHDPFSVGIAIGALGAVFVLLVHSAYDFGARIPANGALAAVCLGIATVSLHTRFNIGRARLLTAVRVRALESRRARRAIRATAVVVSVALAVWIVSVPAAATFVQAATERWADRPAALRGLDTAVAIAPSDPQAREARGLLRLQAALDAWGLGTTLDRRIVLSWDERRTIARPLLDGAIDDFRRGLASTPVNPFLHEYLAKAYWTLALIDAANASDHLRAAVAFLSRAVASAPESPFAYRSLALLAVPQGGALTELGLRAARNAIERDQAMLPELIERFIASGLRSPQLLAGVPASTVDRLELGALLEKHLLLADAAQVYRAAADVATPAQAPVARWRLARLLQRQGRPRDAVAELQKALADDSANPELHLQRAVALAAVDDAGAVDAYQLAVLNAEAMSRRPRAERQLFGPLPARVRAVVADAVGPSETISVRYREAFAQYLTERKRWDQALRQWRMVVDVAPKNAAAHFGRGVALEALGARDRAVEAYREAVALDPNNVQLRLRFADNLWRTDQYYQAINEWRTVLGRAPGNVDARLALARAYVRTGSQSEASHEYQQLLLIDPARPEARQELARLPRPARQ